MFKGDRLLPIGHGDKQRPVVHTPGSAILAAGDREDGKESPNAKITYEIASRDMRDAQLSIRQGSPAGSLEFSHNDRFETAVEVVHVREGACIHQRCFRQPYFPRQLEDVNLFDRVSEMVRGSGGCKGARAAKGSRATDTNHNCTGESGLQPAEEFPNQSAALFPMLM